MASGWTLQRQTRAKGVYWQAVCGKGKDRRAVTLGYLSEGDAEAALARLRSLDSTKARAMADDPDPLPLGPNEPVPGEPAVVPSGARVELSLADPLPPASWPTVRVPVLTDEAIRRWALDGTVDQTLEELQDAHLRELVASGQCAKMPLREFVDRVWAPVRSRGWSAPGSKKQHGPDTAARTWEREEGLWKAINRVLGHVLVGRLDTGKWSDFLAGQGTWSRRTKVLAQNAYTVMLKFAKHRKIIAEIHEFDVILGDDKPTRETVPFLATEANALLDHAPSTMHRALWTLALSLGLRPGEARQLRWEHIEWNKGGGYVHIHGTKTRGSDRILPLPPAARGALITHWMECGEPSTGWAFTYKGQPLGDFRKSLRTAAKRAGIKIERVHPNQLRHTFASIAAFSGLPKVAARTILGHTARSEMLERHYEHARDEQLRESLGVMPHFGGASAAK